MMKIEFIDKNNIDSILWSNDPDQQYLKKYLSPLIKEGSRKYFANINANIYAIRINNKIVPIVQANPKEKNCYVCSPSSQYVDYSLEELKLLNNKMVEKILELTLKTFNTILSSCDFNKVVYVNNWLLSTNLYLELSKEEILAINRELKYRFSEHIILYRSVNHFTNSTLIKNFKSCNAHKILSRQVYITSPDDQSYKEKRNFQKDALFLKETKLQVKTDDFKDEDAEYFLKHYNNLYIDRYTELNPQFTLDFFKNAIKHNLFTFKMIKDNNDVLGVLGYFERNGVMTTPILGFDTQKPKKIGLYRLLTMMLAVESESKGLILNRSAGASHYKEDRGAKPYLEYSYYFYNNCSFKQKISWGIMGLLANSIGAFLMKKYKL